METIPRAFHATKASITQQTNQLLHCKAIPSKNNLSYNLNTLATNCAQFPDDDVLVENVWILKFRETSLKPLSWSYQ